MKAIKNKILAYMSKAGKGKEQEVSVPALDRYLVYVEKEETYVGGELLQVIQQMIEEGTVIKAGGSVIRLTSEED